MSADPDTGLREAFAAAAEDAPPAAGCPDPERLWAGARGEVDPAELPALVVHTASCPACAEAWRLARELPPAADLVDLASARPRRRGTAWIAAAGALAVAAAILLYLRFRGGDPGAPPSPYRGGGPELVMLTADEAELDRQAFELRWEPVEDGASYEVHVFTADLRSIDQALGIATTSHRVAPERIAGVPSGSTLYWRVSATLPNGRRLASRTRRIQLR